MKERKCKHCGLLENVEIYFPNHPKMKCGKSNYCISCLIPARRIPIEDIFYRKCVICDKTKHCNAFAQAPNSLERIKRVSFCRGCKEVAMTLGRNGVSKLRAKKDEEYVIYTKTRSRSKRLANFELHLWRSAKQRAIRKGYTFNLDVENIKIPDKCPVFNVPFIYGTAGSYQYSPSLDRINSSGGYTKDNIQIISMKANTMKSSATKQELSQFANWVLKEDIV